MRLLIANSYGARRATVTRSHLVILDTMADEMCLVLKFDYQE